MLLWNSFLKSTLTVVGLNPCSLQSSMIKCPHKCGKVKILSAQVWKLECLKFVRGNIWTRVEGDNEALSLVSSNRYLNPTISKSNGQDYKRSWHTKYDNVRKRGLHGILSFPFSCCLPIPAPDQKPFWCNRYSKTCAKPLKPIASKALGNPRNVTRKLRKQKKIMKRKPGNVTLVVLHLWLWISSSLLSWFLHLHHLIAPEPYS